MSQVKKRNGQLVEFDLEKIYAAANKAYAECNKKMPKTVIAGILDGSRILQAGYSVIDIEAIQDMVQEVLMDNKEFDVAVAFITYRYERARVRDEKLFKTVASKLRAESVENQNANVDEHSFGGRMGEATRVVTKEYALNNCMSKMARNNHLNNEIYIHDLDSYAVGMHNCLSLPLDDLLAKTVKTRQTSIRPAGSLNTAMQLVAVYIQLQSLQQFGGVSATHLDWTMVPYVRKSFFKHYKDGVEYLEGMELDSHFKANLSIDEEDYKAYSPKAYDYAMEMTIREAKQAAEGLIHNLNSLQSRSGNQLPFSSINYGTCSLTEGRIVTRALLESSIEGTGPLGETPIFPCSIFQCMKGVNRKPGDPNYDLFQLALKSTSKRLYPNYANCDWTGNAGYDPNDSRTIFSTMGKRILSPCKIY